MPGGSRASTSTERTPLTTGNVAPTYVFQSNRLRQHKQRIRQFQCCICATVLAIFVIALVISISYTVNHELSGNNSTNLSAVGILTPDLDVEKPVQKIKPFLRSSWPTADVISSVSLGPFSKDDLQSAGAAGTAALAERDRYEATVHSGPLSEESPSYRHQKAVPTSTRASVLARAGFAADFATREIFRRQNVTHKSSSHWSIAHAPSQVDADWWPYEFCAVINDNSTCGFNKYRTVDGSCNNILHKEKWGVALTPFRRALPADYADGISAPREAKDGRSLPSAREVSVIVHRPIYRNDPKFTVMLAIWGQFMDHDITATALSQGTNAKSISCCTAFETPGLKPHPECFPVRLAPGDEYYHKFNLTCMEFVRSAPAPTCSFGTREQLNQATAYLDGSVVYGSDTYLMNDLREFQNGRLRMFVTPDNRSLLPISDDPTDGCNRAELNKKGKYCFLSGDARANENLHLTTMHLLWARQHNKIAKELHGINPNWSDEILFQESRRIVFAQIQHITYNEFLPVILGPTLMVDTELWSQRTDYYNGYNKDVDATIANEFAASAFRFAHTLLPTLMKKLANDTSSPEFIEMHKMLFNPYDLYSAGGMDSALRGAMHTPSQTVDTYFSKEFKQHLFERSDEMHEKSDSENLAKQVKKPAPCGLDLVSLNIQRGRDHGLPAYPLWREHCGYQRPTSFADLQGIIDQDSLDRISSIYREVDDIDLYTGALSEIPREGGVLGDTITCLITDQFIRLKRGDRFWYETPEKPQAFTIEQLTEIRKTTLARIICDNSDNITSIQTHVMLTNNENNSIIPCKELFDLDMSFWKV